MLVHTVLATMVRDTMCATHITEKWFIYQSVGNRQATQWETGGDLIRDFAQKEEKNG